MAPIAKLISGRKYLINNISNLNPIKKRIFTICMIMLFTASAMAQQLLGVSDPFEFNTLDAQAVPLAPLAVVITMLLGASFMLYRYWKQKKGATT